MMIAHNKVSKSNNSPPKTHAFSHRDSNCWTACTAFMFAQTSPRRYLKLLPVRCHIRDKVIMSIENYFNVQILWSGYIYHEQLQSVTALTVRTLTLQPSSSINANRIVINQSHSCVLIGWKLHKPIKTLSYKFQLISANQNHQSKAVSANQTTNIVPKRANGKRVFS